MSNRSKTKKTKRQDYIGFLIHLGPLLLQGAIATVALVGPSHSSALAASLPFPPDEPLLENNLLGNYSAKAEPAINNGNNILDGFSVGVDDLEEEEVLIYLDNILDIGGNPIDISEQDNGYGFATVNIAPTPQSDRFGFLASAAIAPIFPDSKGFKQTPNLFADDSEPVKYLPSGLPGQTTPTRASAEPTGTPSTRPIFEPEVGAGITTPFLDSGDNIYRLAISMQPIDYSSFSASGSNTDGGNTGTGNRDGNNTGESNTASSNRSAGNTFGGNTASSNRFDSNIGGGNTGSGSGRKKVPEPSTLAMVFLAGLSLCCKRRRRRGSAIFGVR